MNKLLKVTLITAIMATSGMAAEGTPYSISEGPLNMSNGSSTIKIGINSSTYLKDSTYIFATGDCIVNINNGCILDARDSKDLMSLNTNGGTFNLKAGSIFYLPKEVTYCANSKCDDKPFIIHLEGTKDKPVELRYIINTDIAFDGMFPNVTPSYHDYGYKLKLDENGREHYTGIKFTWEGISSADTTIPSSIAKLVPIRTLSISTIRNGKKLPVITSMNLSLYNDIIKSLGLQ